MSEDNKTIRKPQQKRSKLMAKKILDTALKLFCDKGYYNTTTNEIAREASISVGSLYSYFPDKDSIFLEILKQYHCNFLMVFESIRSETNNSIYKHDKKEWLHVLLTNLINLHMSVKTLNRELHALYYTKSEVKIVMDEQIQKIKTYTLEFLKENPDEIQTDNLEVTILLMVDFISSIVDRIVFDDELSKDEKERIINVGVNAIFKVLYE